MRKDAASQNNHLTTWPPACSVITEIRRDTMTNAQIIAAMEAKAKPLTIKSLKEMAIALASKFDDASMAVHEVVMDALMDKMPEDKFCAFCEELENAI